MTQNGYLHATPKDLDNTNTIGKGGVQIPLPHCPPPLNSASAVFSVADTKNVF